MWGNRLSPTRGHARRTRMEVLVLLVAVALVGALVLGSRQQRSRPRSKRRSSHDDGSSALLHTHGFLEPHFGALGLHAGDAGDRGDGVGGDSGGGDGGGDSGASDGGGGCGGDGGGGGGGD